MKFAVIGAALMVLLSGCMRMNMDLTVNDDDTISGSMVIAFPKALLEQAGTTADAVMEQQGIGTSTEPGVTTEKYDQDGYAGNKISFANKPLKDLAKATGTGGTGEELIIKRLGDQLITSGAMDLTGATPDEASGLTQDILDAFDVNVTITFPGEIVSTTGEVSGNTVKWHIPAGEKVSFDTVVNSPIGGSPSKTVLPIVGGVAVLALVAGLVFSRRGKKSAATPEGFEPPAE
jgi:hypothetical protein